MCILGLQYTVYANSTFRALCNFPPHFTQIQSVSKFNHSCNHPCDHSCNHSISQSQTTAKLANHLNDFQRSAHMLSRSLFSHCQIQLPFIYLFFNPTVASVGPLSPLFTCLHAFLPVYLPASTLCVLVSFGSYELTDQLPERSSNQPTNLPIDLSFQQNTRRPTPLGVPTR